MTQPRHRPGQESVGPAPELTLTRSHTYGDACLYDFTFSAGYDDGELPDYGADYCHRQRDEGARSGMVDDGYRRSPDRYSANTLQCYLQIVVQLSLVFNTPLTRADAADILFPQQNHGSALELFDRQLLIAWLSFADRAIGLGDPVDTNGDGVIDTAFGAVLLAAETVRLSPTSTRHQILEQRNLLGRVLGGS